MLYRVIAWHHDISEDGLSSSAPEIREYRFARIGETSIETEAPRLAAAQGWVGLFGNLRAQRIEELGGPKSLSNSFRSVEKVMEITSQWPLGNEGECFLIDNQLEQWLFDVKRIDD